MSTLATPIRSRRQLEDPACVKVVFDAQGRALYFSRSPIPHARQWDDALLAGRSAALLSARGPVRLSPGFSVAVGPNAPVRAGEDREARATPRAGGGPCDPGGRGRRSHLRHRHAGGLPGVCREMAEGGRRKAEGGRRNGKVVPLRPSGVPANLQFALTNLQFAISPLVFRCDPSRGLTALARLTLPPRPPAPDPRSPPPLSPVLSRTARDA